MKPLRILYIAKHDSGGNDDEGAVTHALGELGHTVERVREVNGSRAHRLAGMDICLFHKWDDFAALDTIPVPKVFWYWDLVSYSDKGIESRNQARREWMRTAIPRVALGFCTDGDWVDRDTSGKLVYLPQGADERNLSIPTQYHQPVDILFTGIARGGAKREGFVAWMKEHWGHRFHHIERGTYQENLSKAIARAKIVVAPDSPITDRYSSNRAYVTMGHGGFLLHPRCATLAEQYVDGEDLVMYDPRNRNHLNLLLKKYLDLPHERIKIAMSGHLKTVSTHTYRHRLEKLIAIVRERIPLG